ncbi:unnamed protein product [Adineta steineri]|uniref:long-chain-fatty-acid--CoA ligase n=1 Tax=Adineta steineri TaxID=433720 RepID=A0A815KN47_9BILA|nr:unnamed protein product [Adineta steineri]CAF4083857.1 unnamed protein product [Adineta steineri]
MIIVAGIFIKYCYELFEIILAKPAVSKGAVEIDINEHIYAHPDYIEGLQDPRTFDVHTIYEALLHGFKINSNRPLFSFRESSDYSFTSYTYREVFQMMQEIGSGIVYTGLKPSNETFIGIYGSASVKCALCLYSTWSYSMVPIGIYDSLGKDAVKFIIKHTEIKLVFADDLQRVRNILEWKDENLALKTVITLVEPTMELIKIAEQKNLILLTYEKLRENGRDNPVEFVLPKPNDTGVIMYTSGSTGEPKGCVITHESFICAIFGILQAVNLFKEPVATKIQRVLNYMPLAHMFGCGTIVAVTYLGGEIGFWQGKVDRLIDDFRDFQPTILTMVPRLLNKLYDKVRFEMYKKGILGRILFQIAIKCKLALLRRGNYSSNTLWDKILFHKIRQSFGGHINRVVSTSAPLSSEVSRFSRAAFSCFFIECYGQTECIIGCSQTINDIESGETGIPTPLNHIKLVDVPEKHYYAKDGVGEICIRSPALFKGYLKDEAKTRETIDVDGWLHTGDIGQWTPQKTMKIIDRKKNIYKLSQGEYIAPEKIEDVYARSRFISQVFVYGDSFESFLIAVVILNEDYLTKWTTNEGRDSQTTISFESKQVVLDDMICEGKNRGLMSYEQVKMIEIIREPFTVENGLLTPTFKARRYAIEKKYKGLFQRMYKSFNT